MKNVKFFKNNQDFDNCSSLFECRVSFKGSNPNTVCVNDAPDDDQREVLNAIKDFLSKKHNTGVKYNWYI